MKSVIIAGAGLVSGPAIQYLSKRFRCILLDVVTENLQNYSEISNVECWLGDFKKGYENIISQVKKNLDGLIRSADLVLSLLPVSLHVEIAKRCLSLGKNLVTASYVSPEMQNLHDEAVAKDLLFMNECGADPGVDHMSAMEIFKQIRDGGGEVESFYSFCGGLPSEKDNNPFGYQFSWSPVGVLLVGKNPAKFMIDGNVETIPAGKIFETDEFLSFSKLGMLATYPNRDSVPYKDIYGLDKIKTLQRGTLRYPNWRKTMLFVDKIGFLDDTELDTEGLTHVQVSAKILGLTEENWNRDAIVDNLKARDLTHRSDEIIERLEWLGLFNNTLVTDSRISPLMFLAKIMVDKMKYEDHQTDMLVMRHIVEGKFSDRREKITSTLIAHGEKDGFTIMSKMVGLTAAYAAEMILDGNHGDLRGVQRPVMSEFYRPILEKLEADGIRFDEEVEVIS